MKKSICFFLLAFFAFQLNAQSWNNGRDQTLFSRDHRAGFFVSPIIEYSNLDGEWNTSVGGGMAFVAGDFFIGGYGLGMADFDQVADTGEFNELEMGHGGFWFGYVTPQHYALHGFASVKAGWGGLNFEFDDGDYDDAFFALTPEAGIEVNVFRWFRVGATVGYRFMNGLDETPQFQKDELEGMVGTLTFRIGGFGRNKRAEYRNYRD